MQRTCLYILAALGAAFLGASSAQSGGAHPDTTIATGTYGVAIEYPNILMWLGAKLLGKEPEHLTCEEQRWCGAGHKGFAVTLTADNGTVWFRVTSDTTSPSFTHLPDEPMFPLKAGAIGFFSAFFDALADPGMHRLEGRFAQGDSLLRATASLHYGAFPNGKRPRLTAFDERCFAAVAENATTGNPYVEGLIVAGRMDSCIIYPFAEAHLQSSGITIRAYLERLLVTHVATGKTTEIKIPTR